MLLEKVLFLVGVAVICAATPLDDYVHRDDGMFKYVETREPLFDELLTMYFVNLTSQRWLTSNDSSQSIWWHNAVVFVPHEIRYTEHAYLYITGGSNDEKIPDVQDGELLAVSALCSSLKMVTTILHQVPNQPITFWSDPDMEQRTEDGIIAFTWAHFIDQPDQPEWLARMPMTKAAVAAMNMTSELAAQKRFESNISKFFIGGASKRGWTTWTTAAVDSRVVGITPIVMDALNLVKNLHHQYRALGNWTFAFEDYYKLNITKKLDNPNTQLMADIVDPFCKLFVGHVVALRMLLSCCL
jgi:PhoPQ-activated pathogenicity-related protein